MTDTRPQTPSLPNIGQAIEAVYEHAFGPTPNTSGNWNDAIEAAAKVADEAAAHANKLYEAKAGGEPGMISNEARYRTACNIAQGIRALSQDGMVRKGEQGND